MNRPEFQNHRTLGTDLERLLKEVRMGNASSGEELCRLLRPGIQFLVARRNNSGINRAQVTDKVLTTLLEEIERDQIHDVTELLSHARVTILRGSASAEVGTAAEATGYPDIPPPDSLKVQLEAMRVALEGMPDREREILRRYYVLGQTEDQILEELGLSRAEFQNLKRKAKSLLQGPGSGSD